MLMGTSLFTSARERRLWFWALAVIVAIYATLGWARVLVDALRERGLLRVSFAGVVVLLVAAIVWQWLRARPDWRDIGVALGVGLAYWVAFLRIENPAERTHLIEYGILAALIHMALQERARKGRPVPMPAALTVGVTALLGLADEGIQAVLPNRVFDWIDVFFNAFAGFMVIVARLALAPVKGPGWRLWFMWLMAGAIGWGWSLDPGSIGPERLFEMLPFLPPVNLPAFSGVAAGGILVGVLHGLVLRRYLTQWPKWILASVAASAAFALVFFGVGWFDADLGFLLAIGLYGALAGVLQWWVLRARVPRAGWWVLASALGWLVSIPAGDLNGPPGWAAYGAITGAVMVWLLKQNVNE